MKIKLRTTYASPKITAVSGSIIDVPEKEAVELVSGGYAEYCNAQHAFRQETKVETTMKEPQKEIATRRIGRPMPAGRPKRKAKGK